MPSQLIHPVNRESPLTFFELAYLRRCCSSAARELIHGPAVSLSQILDPITHAQILSALDIECYFQFGRKILTGFVQYGPIRVHETRGLAKGQRTHLRAVR